jgi:hypothetical protein
MLVYQRVLYKWKILCKGWFIADKIIYRCCIFQQTMVDYHRVLHWGSVSSFSSLWNTSFLAGDLKPYPSYYRCHSGTIVQGMKQWSIYKCCTCNCTFIETTGEYHKLPVTTAIILLIAQCKRESVNKNINQDYNWHNIYIHVYIYICNFRYILISQSPSLGLH